MVKHTVQPSGPEVLVAEQFVALIINENKGQMGADHSWTARLHPKIVCDIAIMKLDTHYAADLVK